MIIALGAAALALSCSKPAAPKTAPAVPVVAAAVVQKTMPVELRAIGNVLAYSTVSVLSQVEGTLTAIHFAEGQAVRKGDPLFTIDPRPFQLQLEQAQANLAKDQAQADNARRQADRYGELFKQQLASQDQYEQVKANADALAATARADQAAIDRAKLDLDYSDIRSPLDGITGKLLLHQGNLVKADDPDHPLIVINQIEPIYVAFSVPGNQLSTIQRYPLQKISVRAFASETGEPLGEGTLAFVDNTVDTTTGTIQLKAVFANGRHTLWPGRFVNVAMTLTTQANAVVVPAAAVQNGQTGSYVFVIKPDLTVELRPIVIDRTVGAEVVVQRGVAPGERVVTDGQLRLVAGTKIELPSSAPAATPAPRPESAK